MSDTDSDYECPAYLTTGTAEWDKLQESLHESDGPPVKPERKIGIPKSVKGDLDPSEAYNTDFEERGHFVIFNFMQYTKKSKYYGHNRESSKVDSFALQQRFTQLGFKVKVYDNFDKSEVLRKLKKYGTMNLAKHEMFGMAILTHGEERGALFTADKEMNIKEFVDEIKMNPTLIQKPKLFFVQACRGGQSVTGWTEKVARGPGWTWPLDADILIHFSTIEDQRSYRNDEGSAFIQYLCQTMEHAYDYEFHHLLVRVNNLVAKRQFAIKTGDGQIKRQLKQTAQIQSQLTKFLFLQQK